jgi:hypothetical protein
MQIPLLGGRFWILYIWVPWSSRLWIGKLTSNVYCYFAIICLLSKPDMYPDGFLVNPRHETNLLVSL